MLAFTAFFDKNGGTLNKCFYPNREWRGPKADGHAQEVLDFIKTLN
jgi:hypothetical protein